MASQDTLHRIDTGKVSPLYDPRIRGIFFQSLLFIFLVGFIYWIIGNTVDNLQRAHIASGFGFLQRRAGFDVSDALIAYSSDSTIERALFVGFLNTLLVSVFGIITASILGFLIGIGRLSTNWLIRKICMVYVEIFHNIPPLLVIFFWYIGVLSVLPQPRQSIQMPLGMFLNSRGCYFPKFIWGEHAWLVGLAFLIAVALAIFVKVKATQRQMATGQQFPVLWTSIALILGLPVLAFLLAGMPLSFEVPKLDDFVLPIGKARIHRAGKDVTMVSWGIGMTYAVKAVEELTKEGIDVELIDLRTIRPMDLPAVIESVKKTGRLVTVEEGYPQSSVGDFIANSVQRAAFDYLDAPILSIAGKDVPMPYAANLEKLALPNVGEVVQAVKAVCYK